MLLFASDVYLINSHMLSYQKLQTRTSCRFNALHNSLMHNCLPIWIWAFGSNILCIYNENFNLLENKRKSPIKMFK